MLLSSGGPPTAEFDIGGVRRLVLPPAEALLREGGDTRLALDPVSGRNRYGCASRPDPGLGHFGSATASTISPEGFAAADALRTRLAAMQEREPRGLIYARELDRVRSELIGLCGLEDVAGLDLVFAASGTDLHLLVAELVAASSGLGYLSLKAMRGFQVDVIFLAIAIIGLLGLITDQLFRFLRMRIAAWAQ